ncbi:hypothetical protein Pan216_50050 [Planctomycetes bacterium Pan216]|uniref:Peptidase MA-like domain-containing protein n=1 Tax=Kolteria novifilia TaxID=2527975 RepID=A0A518BAV7_9BACT|nr:hypothetical protein Pan216_50050 [Planctomycetes bacterium Pan216]
MLAQLSVLPSLVLVALAGGAPPAQIVIKEDPTPITLSPADFQPKSQPAQAQVAAHKPEVNEHVEPSVRIEHDDVVRNLKIQSALRKGRGLVGERRYAEAITVLEPHLTEAAGADQYLDTLAEAYRGQINELLLNRKSDEARLLAQRLRILTPEAQAGNVAAPTTRPTAAPPTVERSRGRAIPRAQATSKPKYQARAKLDTTPAIAHGQTSLLKDAERLFAAKQYAQALPLYEKAYEQDPIAAQPARERWGYCLLFVSVDKYNRWIEAPVGTHSAGDWEQLEADVRLAKRLAPSIEYTQTVLNAISDRKQDVQKPNVARTDNAAIHTGTSQYPLVNAPACPMRHLPTAHGQWSVIETANFRIHHRDRALGEEVARLAEAARKMSHEMWFGSPPQRDWTPRCDVFLYPTAQEYTQVTGVPAQSPGHSKVLNENGRIRSRRLELRCDDPNMKLAILPHEITHVVLAGKFGAHDVPRWADEGMAVLTEPRDKQDAHLGNLYRCQTTGRRFSCSQMFTMREYPPGPQMRDFYAHSVGICRYLVEMGGAEKLPLFINTALQNNNYELALRQVYGINGVTDLESKFGQYVASIPNGGNVGVATARR